MKTRFSVARCCCPGDVQPIEDVFTNMTWHVWDETQLVIPVPGLGADNLDNNVPWGVYPCNQATRITNVTIPQGANIISAIYREASQPTISFTFDTQGTGNPLPATRFFRIRAQCEDTDNSLPSVSAADWEARSRTTAGVDYDLQETGGIGGTTAPVMNMQPALQEVVNRPGWVSGNAISLMFDDNGSDFGDTGTAFRWGVFAGGSVGGDELVVEYIP